MGAIDPHDEKSGNPHISSNADNGALRGNFNRHSPDDIPSRFHVKHAHVRSPDAKKCTKQK
jgi:hypothetical protein